MELSFAFYFFVFALAAFVGFELITKVPPTLHTPLMSGSNAISGVTVVGAILSVQNDQHLLGTVLGLLALIAAMVWAWTWRRRASISAALDPGRQPVPTPEATRTAIK